ncbi:inositol monophosphatase family protein, partial [Agrococcus casei]|uniref:inositol monophosphatase family protein n=1 Tax=Agrococcus casei TaxID=343512 RepID=UPI003F91F0AA
MHDLLELARTTAVEASDLARTRRAEGVEIADRKSSITDVVTAADREVEQLVLERIRATRPDDGILGEEGTSIEGTSGVTWVVDPIDGTVNYLYGVGEYAVSIAAVEGPASLSELRPSNWTGLAGVVAAPVSGRVFEAARGAGATVNGSGLAPSAPASLAEALVATGFGYDDQRRRKQGEVVAKLLPRVRDVRRMGAGPRAHPPGAAGAGDPIDERGGGGGRAPSVEHPA